MMKFDDGEGTALTRLTKRYLIQCNPQINFKLLKNNIYFLKCQENDSWYDSRNHWGNYNCRPSPVRLRRHRKSQALRCPVH